MSDLLELMDQLRRKCAELATAVRQAGVATEAELAATLPSEGTALPWPWVRHHGNLMRLLARREQQAKGAAEAYGYDADAWRDAHQPWTLRIGGRTYTAHLVSAEQVRTYLEHIEDADPLRQRLALARLFRAAFPFRLRYLIQGDPVRRLLALPEGAQAEALQAFFAHRVGLAVTPARGAISAVDAPSSAST